MRVLITGVTGFVGSHLAEYLADCGDEVFGCARTGRWPPETPFPLASQSALQRWDLTRGAGAEVRAWAKSIAPEVVYHLAGRSLPAECGRDGPSPEAQAANVTGTRAVVDLVASLPGKPRLLFSSSSHVYAAVKPQAPLVAEDAPLEPRRGYGMTKLAAEGELQEAVKRVGLNAVIARAFQHTGPRQSAGTMIPDWVKQFVQSGREPIRVVCLDTFLDLSDVRDVVRAYRELALQGGIGEVYNVGSGTCRRSGDIFEQIRQLYDPRRDVIELSPGRRQHPIADTSKLAARTGWRPTIPLEKTLSDTLDFWQQRELGP